ncbi:MAG: hypothetical protein GXY66_07395 [Bacteroidales bacterium]|nr:hypothetical protein [Bacteroidales bacterium]OQC04128.1 MAG: hypothetical protein BWX77_00288 [Bacteroidetes bacterium ADurb.Bin090]HOD27540.1 LPP20 family lipoprotein [Bacteroidales bacterium]
MEVKRYAIFLCILLSLPLVLQAQRQREKRLIEEQVAAIRNNPEYLSAVGVGESMEEADRQALAALSSQITVCVSSQLDVQTSVEQTTDNFSKTDRINSQIQTYSMTNLPNVKRIEISEEPEAQVLRYMRADEVDQIFRDREDKIKNYVKMGMAQETRLQIADALRYYSWALTLLLSHPKDGSIVLDLPEGIQMPAKPWLDSKINEILSGINVRVSDAQEHEDAVCPYTLLLNITYQGHPVSNLDYYYHNGQTYIGPISAKDGRGMADFFEYPQDFRFRCEYTFRSQAENLDRELRAVLNHINPQHFPAATQTVVLDTKMKKLQKAARKAQETEQAVTMVSTGNVASVVDAAQEQEILRVQEAVSAPPAQESLLTECMQQVEQAIRNKNYEYVEALFTDEGYDMFRQLIAYGNASVVSSPRYKFLKVNDGYLCKSLPLQFKFKGNKILVEDVTFRFTPENKINSLAFTLNKIAENDILKMKSWEEDSRICLIRFLEDYQTAYALKRLDYIESIFSDDAWIITGTVLKKAELKTEDRISFDSRNVRYTTYTKQEYIDKLRISFAGKEFINLRFEENDVRKDARGQEIYAIQIKQDYYSNNYGDSGYLTLLVDLRGKLPIIHIRVWQEKKDEEFSAARFLSSLQ